MKIALVFCGQPRNISEKLYKLFHTHILSKYDVDVYAHFWYDDTQQNPIGVTHAPWVKNEWLTIRPDLKKIFQDLYNPKKVVWDTPLSHTDKSYTHAHYSGAGYNILSYYTSIRRAFELIDNLHQYEYIVHTRPDISLYRFPNLHTGSRQLYLCRKYLKARGHSSNGLDNTIWAVPREFAETVCSMVVGIETQYAAGVIMNDEEMFYAYIDSQNLLNIVNEGMVLYELTRA